MKTRCSLLAFALVLMTASLASAMPTAVVVEEGQGAVIVEGQMMAPSACTRCVTPCMNMIPEPTMEVAPPRIVQSPCGPCKRIIEKKVVMYRMPPRVCAPPTRMYLGSHMRPMVVGP